MLHFYEWGAGYEPEINLAEPACRQAREIISFFGF